jgi:hypothetical protein
MITTAEEALHLLSAWHAEKRLIHCWCGSADATFQVIGWIADVSPKSVSVRAGKVPDPPAGYFDACISLEGARIEYLEGRDARDAQIEEMVSQTYDSVLMINTPSGRSFGLGLMRPQQP